MDLTAWAIGYLSWGIFTYALALHVYWRNWWTFRHYRLTRTIAAIHIPYSTLMTSIFCFEGIRILLGWPEWFISAYWILVFFLFYLLLGSLTLIMALRLYGQAWIVRQKFGSRPVFGPYLTFGAEPTTTMVLTWEQSDQRKEIPNGQDFRLGTSPDALDPHVGTVKVNHRLARVTLTGLQPGTTYYYQIPQKTETFHFQTAPRWDANTEAAPAFEFVIVGDLHGSGKDVSQTVKLIHELGPNVKFILSPGDITTDARIWQHWRTLWNQMRLIAPNLPLESAPGNHDVELARGAIHWLDIFPYPYANPTSGFYFTFTYLNTAFFILDNYNAGRKQGSSKHVPAPEQIAWLDQELAKLPPAIEHRVLVIHKAIYTTGDFGCDPDLEALLLPLITKYRVNLVVTGHSHLFEAFFRPDLNLPRGTALLVTGGGGGKLDWVSMKYSAAPYRWSGSVHVAKSHPFLEGDSQSPYRNDAVVCKYQEYGKLCRHILHVIIKGEKMTVRAIEWGGTVIYERTW